MFGVTYKDISEEGKNHWGRNVIPPLLLVRSVKRDRQGHEEGKKVWRGREQQGRGAVVSQCPDDGGKEIVEGLGGDEGHLQDDKHVQFAVTECLFQSPPDGLGVLVYDSGVLFPYPPFLIIWVSKTA